MSAQKYVPKWSSWDCGCHMLPVDTVDKFGEKDDENPGERFVKLSEYEALERQLSSEYKRGVDDAMDKISAQERNYLPLIGMGGGLESNLSALFAKLKQSVRTLIPT